MKFNPCKGRDFCTETGTHCKGCGRSYEEIAETKALISHLIEFIQKQGYENPKEFMDYVSEKVLKKL